MAGRHVVVAVDVMDYKLMEAQIEGGNHYHLGFVMDGGKVYALLADEADKEQAPYSPAEIEDLKALCEHHNRTEADEVETHLYSTGRRVLFYPYRETDW